MSPAFSQEWSCVQLDSCSVAKLRLDRPTERQGYSHRGERKERKSDNSLLPKCKAK
jgi:hypothetical protein